MQEQQKIWRFLKKINLELPFDPAILLLGAWQPTPVFLPGESHGQRSLVDYSPEVAKSWI